MLHEEMEICRLTAYPKYKRSGFGKSTINHLHSLFTEGPKPGAFSFGGDLSALNC